MSEAQVLYDRRSGTVLAVHHGMAAGDARALRHGHPRRPESWVDPEHLRVLTVDAAVLVRGQAFHVDVSAGRLVAGASGGAGGGFGRVGGSRRAEPV